MPVIRHDLEKLEPGSFYVNIRTGRLVEVMDVDLHTATKDSLARKEAVEAKKK